MALSKVVGFLQVTGTHVFTDEVVQTPQEVRAEVARERREAKKERQLDRKVKRQNKRSQAY